MDREFSIIIESRSDLIAQPIGQCHWRMKAFIGSQTHQMPDLDMAQIYAKPLNFQNTFSP